MGYRIERVYYPYWEWEDYKNGMWRNVTSSEKEKLIYECISLISNTALFGSFMVRTIDEWTISAEHNLTALSSNRRAWVGQAASCFAISCPEDITRISWGMSSEESRDNANKEADKAISLWQDRYIATNKKQGDLF